MSIEKTQFFPFLQEEVLTYYLNTLRLQEKIKKSIELQEQIIGSRKRYERDNPDIERLRIPLYHREERIAGCSTREQLQNELETLNRMRYTAYYRFKEYSPVKEKNRANGWKDEVLEKEGYSLGPLEFLWLLESRYS